MSKNKVVLAYSGGLDTSVSIKWIQDKYQSDVITLTLDLGQGEELSQVEEKAKSLGVLKHYSLDVKEVFASKYVLQSIKANGLYEGKYPLSTALGRPLIAQMLVEVAEKENAQAVAHGCTGKGNDQVRIDVTVKALNPDLRIIAPVREWGLTRDQEIAYAKENGVPISAKKSVYSIDQNIWGRSIESGVLEDASVEPPEDAFEWVVPPEEAPDRPTYVKIGFERGIPISLDGEELSSLELIGRMNSVAGRNGVGIIDHIEDRLVGIKSREVYECPAATVLLEAHKELEKLVMTRHQLTFKRTVDQAWSDMVYMGLWVDPLKKNLDAFIDSSQERVSGTVTVKMYKGNVRVVGRSSAYSIYDLNLATYSSASTFNQNLAEGFIEFWGLPSRVAMMKAKAQKVTA
ncbi:MAG: argininosuccinate synthase [Conexivisphaerales archaeon]